MPACCVKSDVYEFGRFSPGEVVSFFVVPAEGMGRKTSETTTITRETPRGAIRGTGWGVRRRRGGVIWRKLGEDDICHRHLPLLISSRVRTARSCHRMQHLAEHPLDKATEPFFRFCLLPRRKFANCLDTKIMPFTSLCARQRHAIRAMCPLLAPHRMDDARMMGADCGSRLGPRFLPPPPPIFPCQLNVSHRFCCTRRWRIICRRA